MGKQEKAGQVHSRFEKRTHRMTEGGQGKQAPVSPVVKGYKPGGRKDRRGTASRHHVLARFKHPLGDFLPQRKQVEGLILR